MKKKIFIFFVIIFCSSILNAESKSDMIKSIKTKYYSIENNISKYKLTESSYFSAEEPSIHFEAYTDDKNNIVKLEEKSGDSGEGWAFMNITTYYFHNKKLFFVFRESSESNLETGKTTYAVEERIYLFNDKIIEALIKIADDGDLSKIKNKKNEDVLNKLDENTEMYINGSKKSMEKFYISLSNQ